MFLLPDGLFLLAFAFACGGEGEGPYTDADGIRRDAKDCWADGEQIWDGFAERYCSAACGRFEADEVSLCIDSMLARQERVRDTWCVDPCAVDACFEVWDQYLDTCSEADSEAAFEQCNVGPEAMYWDANNPDRPWSPTCAGW